MPDRGQAEVQVKQELSLSNEPGLLKRVEKLDAVVCPHVQAVFSWVYSRLERRGNSVTFLWDFFARKANSPTKGFQAPGFTFGVSEDFPSV